MERLEQELLHSGGDRVKEIRVGMLVIVHYEDVCKVRQGYIFCKCREPGGGGRVVLLGKLTVREKGKEGER